MATIRLSRRSLAVRWYSWVYGAQTTRISFCALFWGLLCSPIVAVLKPFGFGALALVERIADWTFVRSLAKEERTGKTWEQRHPHLGKWLETPSFVGQLAFSLPLIVLFDVIFLIEGKPWSAIIYTAFMVVWAGLLALVRNKKPRTKPGWLGTAYHSLKSRTCPVVEVD